jgi:F0F1-type ATP synthase membrane subunit c/vacuolar-type H+-ATPase subunit K
MEVSITTFISFNLLYVIWIFFIISSETASGFNGSIMYVPHAARVLTICYFGISAIPALFAAHIFCTSVIGGAYGLNNLMFVDLIGTSFLSTVCVLVALYAMAGLGFKIRTLPFYEFTKDSVYLDLRNHKHIIMVTVFSAAVHALSLYVYNYLRAISSNPEMFIRFFVGDILGTLVTLFALSFMLFAFFRER